MIHNININNYIIEPSEIEGGTSGSFGNEQLSFSFSQEWNGLNKSVTFYPPRSKPVYVMLTDNVIDIPPEATARSGKTVFVVEGFEMVEDDLKRVIRSVTGTINVISTLKGEGAESRQPTPTELQQIMAALAGKQDRLVAGANIQINGNVISAMGGGGGADILVIHVASGEGEPGEYGEVEVSVDVDNATLSAYALAKKPVFAFTNFFSGGDNYPVPMTKYRETDDGFGCVFSANVYATSITGYLYYVESEGKWYVVPDEFERMDYTWSVDEDSTNEEYPTAKAVYEAVKDKQDKLTAGSGISIVNNVISATGGGGGVFIATYGTTTYAQVKAAYDAGKAIYCVKTETMSGFNKFLSCVQFLDDRSGTNKIFSFFAKQGSVERTTSLNSSNQWAAFNERTVYDVSGTNDGTNWTSLTIESVTKNIPSGGAVYIDSTTTYAEVQSYFSAGKEMIFKYLETGLDLPCYVYLRLDLVSSTPGYFMFTGKYDDGNLYTASISGQQWTVKVTPLMRDEVYVYSGYNPGDPQDLWDWLEERKLERKSLKVRTKHSSAGNDQLYEYNLATIHESEYGATIEYAFTRIDENGSIWKLTIDKYYEFTEAEINI